MEIPNPNLSYVITTRNRLEYLKIILPILLSELKDDEEIVIVDSGSNDGSKEYLQDLFTRRIIHQFLSEPDKNQAHGWNKAMLLARGRLIKKIIDDDVFCFSAIRECKEFMLKNPSVDVCISNESSIFYGKDISTAFFHSHDDKFLSWKRKITKSFPFSDVHILIRKNSLSLIGLYNTSFTMMDWEYSLRITFLQANLAYYTGYNALGILHPASISSKVQKQVLKDEEIRGCTMYNYNKISNWSKLKIFLGKKILINRSNTQKLPNLESFYDLNPTEVYKIYHKFIEDRHSKNKKNYKFHN
ncbi:glycosyltransferase [Pedobacter sp. ASV28]|uniref:glycosyltransferase n=1 Tax=Pedobacter sp. ASV28 TaxID=2795123 RepID=UPI0018ED07F1|nr:glycosyltransferase [Pedobacter sp. ASV28]